MERKTIGTFIAILRKSSGMTQKELAEKLNVSDKTVSHWERDENAPDISLIPVIAEIFAVTCDELLRGEKMPENAPAVTSTAKGEKQMKYLLEKSLGRLKIRQIICAGISLIGLIAGVVIGLILNRLIFMPYTTFLTACIFFLTAIILSIVFHMVFISSVKSEDFDGETVNAIKQRANSMTAKSVFFTVIISCVSLFLADHFADVPYVKSVVYSPTALIVCFIVFVFLKSSGILPKWSKAEKKLFVTRLTIIAAAVALIICGVGTQRYFENDHPHYPKYIDFYDPDEFKQFMETPKASPDYTDRYDDFYAYEKEEDIRETYTDENGEAHTVYEIGYKNGDKSFTFEWLNGEVCYYEKHVDEIVDYENTDDFYIRVFTYKAIHKSGRFGPLGDAVGMAAYVYYPLVVIIAIAMYLTVTKRSKRK